MAHVNDQKMGTVNRSNQMVENYKFSIKRNGRKSDFPHFKYCNCKFLHIVGRKLQFQQCHCTAPFPKKVYWAAHPEFWREHFNITWTICPQSSEETYRETFFGQADGRRKTSSLPVCLWTSKEGDATLIKTTREAEMRCSHMTRYKCRQYFSLLCNLSFWHLREVTLVLIPQQKSNLNCMIYTCIKKPSRSSQDFPDLKHWSWFPNCTEIPIS